MINKDLTIELISLALDASLLRQTVIAHNIANASSSGYQELKVNFEQQLKGINFKKIHPFIQSSEMNSSIDYQLIESVKNMTHFRALIKGLNQKLTLIKLALGNSSS